MGEDLAPGVSAGRLVLVVGPSGVGKDTLIDYARERLRPASGIRFVRRVITRPASVGEDHEPAGVEEFRRRAEAGGFALSWQAHGLYYGIPRIVDVWLACRQVVVANASRAILSAARRRFAQLFVVDVTAPPAVLAQRLASRGRENAASRQARLARSDLYRVDGDEVLHIDNAGALSIAGDQLVRALATLADTARRGDDIGSIRCTMGRA
jgi:ribose 1,5-bisphosphokinase